MQKFQVVAWMGSRYARARMRRQEPGVGVLLVLVQIGVLVIMIQLITELRNRLAYANLNAY